MLTSLDKVAVLAGKISAGTIRLLGAGMGSNLPGKVARRLSADILADLSTQTRLGSIAVSGTNGKSTTAGLLSSILRTVGFKLVHNRQGANLITGITASLIDSADWFGKINADYGIFEIDEAALPMVAREVPLKAVLVTNLFRDQLDRFGELDTTAKLITLGIKEKSSWAILNADDPNVSQLVSEGKRIYFGIESFATDSLPFYEPSELAYCRLCQADIQYDFKTYGQLGKWRCSTCQQRRPELQISAREVRLSATGSIFALTYENYSAEIKLGLPGLFNVYNALAAAAAAISLGVTLEAVKDGVKQYTTLFGRSEKLTLQNRSVIIQLIKNPTGASQSVQSLIKQPEANVLIAINDNYADGRDVSWLWDADFEPLSDLKGKFVVAGQRAEDMALRLKYAGVAPQQIECVPFLHKALELSLAHCKDGQALWILPTYTCLLELRKILRKAGTKLGDS